MEDIHIQQTKDIGVEVVFMGIRQENIFIVQLFGSNQYDEGCECIKSIHLTFYFSTYIMMDNIH